MTAYKIDRDIPIPTLTGAGHKLNYPWDALAVGESFAAHPSQKIRTLRSLASSVGRSRRKRFVVKDTGFEFRVWRIS